jgi:succinate dehydrogenase flavin-adding protein (antitoxin of CptAB toxin-antitoxin module)
MFGKLRSAFGSQGETAMPQQILFIARVRGLMEKDQLLKSRLEALLAWANTDERVLRLLVAMLNEKNRVEALEKRHE